MAVELGKRVKNIAKGGVPEIVEHVVLPVGTLIAKGTPLAAGVVLAEGVLDVGRSYDRLTNLGREKPTRRELRLTAVGKGIKYGLLGGTLFLGPQFFLPALLGVTIWDASRKQTQMKEHNELAPSISQGIGNFLKGGRRVKTA